MLYLGMEGTIRNIQRGQVYEILCQKYSQQPRITYESQQFQQFLKPINKCESPSCLQLECLEFLHYTTDKEHIPTYHTLEQIYFSITHVILKNAKNHPACLPHFYEHGIYTRMKKYQSCISRHNLILAAQKINRKEEQKQNSSSLKHSLSKTLPQSFKPLLFFSPTEEVSPLQHTYNDLSFMLEKLNKNQLQANLSTYLRQIKSYLTKNKNSNISFGAGKKQRHGSERKGKGIKSPLKGRDKMQQQSYGLNKIRETKESNQKKRVTFFRSTQTIREKVIKREEKIIGQVPKFQTSPHNCSVNERNMSSFGRGKNKGSKPKRKHERRGK